jgi:hypothetical protein
MIFLDEFGAPSKPVVGPRRRNIGEIIADGSSPVDDTHLCRTIEGGVSRVVNIRWDLAAHAHEEIVFHTMRRHAKVQSLGSHCLG